MAFCCAYYLCAAETFATPVTSVIFQCPANLSFSSNDKQIIITWMVFLNSCSNIIIVFIIIIIIIIIIIVIIIISLSIGVRIFMNTPLTLIVL